MILRTISPLLLLSLVISSAYSQSGRRRASSSSRRRASGGSRDSAPPGIPQQQNSSPPQRRGQARASPPACSDSSEDCYAWAAHCPTNTAVQSICPRTCGLCTGPDPDCQDTESQCSEFAQFCGKKGFVIRNCKKTCGECGGAEPRRDPDPWGGGEDPRARYDPRDPRAQFDPRDPRAQVDPRDPRARQGRDPRAEVDPRSQQSFDPRDPRAQQRFDPRDSRSQGRDPRDPRQSSFDPRDPRAFAGDERGRRPVDPREPRFDPRDRRGRDPRGRADPRDPRGRQERDPRRGREERERAPPRSREPASDDKVEAAEYVNPIHPSGRRLRASDLRASSAGGAATGAERDREAPPPRRSSQLPSEDRVGGRREGTRRVPVEELEVGQRRSAPRPQPRHGKDDINWPEPPRDPKPGDVWPPVPIEAESRAPERWSERQEPERRAPPPRREEAVPQRRHVEAAADPSDLRVSSKPQWTARGRGVAPEGWTPNARAVPPQWAAAASERRSPVPTQDLTRFRASDGVRPAATVGWSSTPLVAAGQRPIGPQPPPGWRDRSVTAAPGPPPPVAFRQGKLDPSPPLQPRTPNRREPMEFVRPGRVSTDFRPKAQDGPAPGLPRRRVQPQWEQPRPVIQTAPEEVPRTAASATRISSSSVLRASAGSGHGPMVELVDLTDLPPLDSDTAIGRRRPVPLDAQSAPLIERVPIEQTVKPQEMNRVEKVDPAELEAHASKSTEPAIRSSVTEPQLPQRPTPTGRRETSRPQFFTQPPETDNSRLWGAFEATAEEAGAFQNVDIDRFIPTFPERRIPVKRQNPLQTHRPNLKTATQPPRKRGLESSTCVHWDDSCARNDMGICRRTGSYNGTRQKTVDGTRCKAWAETPFKEFPDNFCRSTPGWPPWCFKVDSTSFWDFSLCFPTCDGSLSFKESQPLNQSLLSRLNVGVGLTQPRPVTATTTAIIDTTTEADITAKSSTLALTTPLSFTNETDVSNSTEASLNLSSTIETTIVTKKQETKIASTTPEYLKFSFELSHFNLSDIKPNV